MSQEKISIEEAKKYIENVSRRIALLHLAYAKAIIEELRDEGGLELIAKAIRLYGRYIGEEVRNRVLEKGLKPTVENWVYGEDLPPLGMHEKSTILLKMESLGLKPMDAPLQRYGGSMRKIGWVGCTVT